MRSSTWVIATVLACAAMPLPAAEDGPNWRHWGVADGLTESFTTALTPTPDGSVLVRHGDLKFLDILNGYSDRKLPENRAPGRPYEGPEGDLFTFDNSGLWRFDGRNWLLHKFEEFAGLSFSAGERFRWYEYPNTALDIDGRAAAIPIGRGRVVLMFPEKLVEWNRATGEKSLIRLAGRTSLGRFNDLSLAPDGDIWVSGQRGIAKLSVRHDVRHDNGTGVYGWNEIPVSATGFTRYAFPAVTPSGAILLSALAVDGSKKILLGRGNHWETVYNGDRNLLLRAWPGEPGQILIANDSRLFAVDEVSSGHPEVRPVDLPPGITGRFYDVLPQKDGVFWLATSQVVARYTPRLWQAPADAPKLETVNTITEGDNGALWFASGNKLVSYRGGEWRSVPFPDGDVQDETNTSSVVALGKGHVLVRTANPDHLLDFNSETHTFRLINQSDGLRTGLIRRRDATSVWAARHRVGEVGGKTCRIEIFDGTRFTPVRGMESLPSRDIRDILQTRDGTIWIGFIDKLIAVRNGKAETVPAQTGLAEGAVFGLFQSPDGTIYVGQRDSVSAFDGKQFHVLHKGLDRARVFSMTKDGTLWIASGTGVHRYRNGIWITNAMPEGLPSQAAYSVLADTSGRLWAGTTRGLAVYHPETDSDPPVTMVEEERNLRKTPPGGEVRLNFSGMDRWKLTPEDRLLFSWKLDDAAWGPYEGRTFEAFRSLPAGFHVFSVRAMDRNGNIDPNPASFRFNVLLPWYREKGFFAVAALLAITLILLIRQILRYQEGLIFQSRHDPLTSLPNRLELEERLQRDLEDSRRKNTCLAVLFVDLDGFKKVNDLHGHRTGDTLLSKVGLLIAGCLREGDTSARLGGDEFAFVTRGISCREQAAAMAERIRCVVHKCALAETLKIDVRASIGIAVFPDDAVDGPTLLRLADFAMYRSKARGGDCFTFYEPSMSERELDTSPIVALLRNAIVENRFHVLYQPITNQHGEVVQMEALVRIRSAEDGLIAPDRFIGVAEDTGLILQLGEAVLRTACAQARQWREEGHAVAIAVNVSPLQIETPDFAGTVLRMLAREGLPPSALVIEVTESAMSRHQTSAEACLARLREAGLKIAIDDFGTGYSSLSVLDRLPVDGLKIDRHFTAQMISNPRTYQVLIHTVRLARSLGLTVVMEGIETDSQLKCGQDISCDFFQGYLLARPLEPEDATDFLKGRVLEHNVETSSELVHAA